MLSEALKQIRVFHQIKQVDLAQDLGISKSYLSEIESGRKTISIDLLEKYSKIFSIPASSLLLFSENLDAAKTSDKLRLRYASKIMDIMKWINSSNEIKSKA